MATDNTIQRRRIFKEISLKKIKIAIMTGDSIAYRLSLDAPIAKSNYIYRKNANQYLYTTAIAGSNIANFTGGDSSTWNPLSVVTRSDALETNAFDVTNTDLLLVWGGFNDKNDNIPLGAINSNDSLTIAGAIRNTVANYQVRTPNMKLIWITPNANPFQTNNTLGLNIIDYRNHIISVCSSINVPCFDLYDICGITEENKVEALPDEIHPSSDFLESWSPLIAEFVLANL